MYIYIYIRGEGIKYLLFPFSTKYVALHLWNILAEVQFEVHAYQEARLICSFLIRKSFRE